MAEGFYDGSLSIIPMKDESQWLSYQSSSSPTETMSSSSSTNSQNQAPPLVMDNMFLHNVQSIAQYAVESEQLEHNQTIMRRFNEEEHETESICTLSENFKVKAKMFDQGESKVKPYVPLLSVLPETREIHKTSPKTYCRSHQIEKTIYCETCSVSVCYDCMKKHHLHRTVSLSSVSENERCRARYTIETAQAELMEIKDNFDETIVAEEALFDQSTRVAVQVMNSIKLIKNALEEKEQELLGKIENARRQRFIFLENKLETVRNMETALSEALAHLTQGYESDFDPVRFINLQRRKLAEVDYVRYLKHNLPDSDEYKIKLVGRQERVIGAINELTCIVESIPRQERSLPVRNRFANRPQNAVGFGRMLPISPAGRPIPLSSEPVVVKCYRTTKVQASLIIKHPDGHPLALARPWGVACDIDGNIAIADRSNNRIIIYHINGVLIRVFGDSGTGPLEFDRPAGIVIDGRKRIVIADKDNHRIQVVSLEGRFLFEFGSRGNRYGQFNYPWDLATNAENQILVSDTRNHRIQLFSAEGIFLRKFGFDPGHSMWKLFDSPRGVAFTPEGNIIVADFNNHHLLCIDHEMNHQRLIRLDIIPGGKSLQRPQGLTIDDAGNIIIADSKNNRIVIYDRNGRLICRFGTLGSGSAEMDRPSGLALTRDGSIALIDFGNNRLAVY